MSQQERFYPIGIQTFSEIISSGRVYVDKTDLMWKAQRLSKFVFLSRPRRFGKSLLSTTFKSFFEGRRDLFEGLKVMELERDWTAYPVIHLDLSMAKNEKTESALQETLLFIMAPYAKEYNVTGILSPGKQLSLIIRNAFEKTGKQVVVLIDEYDAPLLDVLHESELLDAFRRVMQEFYQVLKASEAMIRFCFITGVTKFSQLSIFSTINNLNNISMLPQFAAICGITETELTTQLTPDVALLAEVYEEPADVTLARLKARYDGYHFSWSSEDIYNPYSLLKAFANKVVDNYWFESGTPTFLINQLQQFDTDITALDDVEASSSAFDSPTEAMTDALPLLYQSGYVTIKGYDRESDTYTLGIPNREVRVGLAYGLLPVYVGLKQDIVKLGFALKFWRALKSGDIEGALRGMQTYFEGLPYIAGFKRKLAEVSTAEGFYEWTFYLIFSMLNVYVRTQVKTIRGRADMVVHMPGVTYVFELKVNGTAQEAMEQINSKGYAIPYTADGRVVKVGMRFSTETLAIEDWVVEG